MHPVPDAPRPIDRLLSVMATLRSETGCPWDRKQTLASLKPFLIEEAYEVLDAIDSDCADSHREELGDLLLQVVFQAQLRREQGAFDFEDVAAAITEKLIRRHPHVFGDTVAEDPETVLRNWDAIKREEKREAGKPPSVLEGVPSGMPALLKAQEVQKRVARVGFDWSDLEPVFAKIREEESELREAVDLGDDQAVHEELGDLLFAVVNLARKLGVSAEEALQHTVHKFRRRFLEVERRVGESGLRLEDCSLADLDVHWNAVKAGERNPA